MYTYISYLYMFSNCFFIGLQVPDSVLKGIPWRVMASASKLQLPPPLEQVDATQRSSYTGELVPGKQVLSPLRFFVSDPQLH